jgi:chromosome transmission fidelity protein 8
MSSSVPLHPRPVTLESSSATPNPLPQLLQTPSGLAILELQGTINLPETSSLDEDEFSTQESRPSALVSIGRLDFPDFNPNALDPSSTAWMKRVHMYIGEHQRLAGEVKKLPKPLAVVRRRGTVTGREKSEEEESAVELEVVEIVKYKLVFAQRPEPVTKT